MGKDTKDKLNIPKKARHFFKCATKVFQDITNTENKKKSNIYL